MEFAKFITKTTALRVADRMSDDKKVSTYVDAYTRRGAMQGYVIRIHGIIQTEEDVKDYV